MKPEAVAAQAGDAPSFAAGEIVAGRYRVLRGLAAGGVGEVYEVEDEELRTRLALKVLRPEASRDPAAVERLRRETLLARKVTHPNVCRTFDAAQHRHADGRVSLVLTMELLGGESLQARLAREGPLDAAAAWPLAEQVAAGLSAAHAAGVVHGDVKAANVMLAPSDGGRLRAVVTDFGLAGESGEGGSGTSGGGTLAYLAPERLLGQPVSVAADVYAFGALLFELVTGRTPLESAQAGATLADTLLAGPPSPRLFAPGLDRRWERVILRCLQPDPAARFASLEDVARALRPARRRARRRAWLAAGGVAALLLAGWTARVWPPGVWPSAAPGATIAPVRRSLAVIGFRNGGARAEDAWLGTALAEMLATELAAGERLRVASGEDVAQARAELGLAAPDALDAPALARLRRALGTDIVVGGVYVVLGAPGERRVRVDLRLHDAARGELLWSLAASGEEHDLFAVVADLGRRVRERVDPGRDAQARAAQRAGMPAALAAQRAYAEGLEALRAFDAVRARPLLEEAIAFEPDFPLAHVALSEAWAALGYDARARAEAERAHALAAGLGRADRLQVEARHHEVDRDWRAAAETLRQLVALFPDEVDFGLRLAAAQAAAGDNAGAFEALSALRARLPASADDPRVDLAESDLAFGAGDFQRAQRAAQRAVRHGEERGARGLAARAWLREGLAYQRLGASEQALAALDQSRALYQQLGHPGGQAWALRNRGLVLAERGDARGAADAHAAALAVFRESGDRRGIAATLNLRGTALAEIGDAVGAELCYGEALAVFREIGDRSGVARVLGKLAAVADGRGELARAEELYREALASFRAAGDKSGAALCLAAESALRRRRGRLREARAGLEEALALGVDTGQRRSEAIALHVWGDLARVEDRLAEARERLGRALALRQGLDHPGELFDTRLALCRLALDEGRAAEALERARALAGDTLVARDATRAAAAWLLVAQAERAARSQQAGPAALRALERARAAGNASLALAAEIEAARSEGTSDARERLDAARRRARARGDVESELEARLALAERTAGAARERALREVSLAAQTRGFLLLARQASEAAARP